MKSLQFYRQAVQLLKENPLVSVISILGVAFSVAMLMVVVILYQIQTANFKPENKRDRMLYMTGVSAVSKRENNRNNSGLGEAYIKACLSNLKNAEMITVVNWSQSKQISLPGKDEYKKYSVMGTDAAFWQVFYFDFIGGRPYSKEEFESQMKVAVVSDDLAREQFGRADVVGQTMLIDFTPYTIVGVVKKVSTAASKAYSKVWIPCLPDNGYYEGVCGQLAVYILARSSSDFDKIRAEIEENVRKYNTTLIDFEVDLRGRPYTHFMESLTWNYRDDTKAFYKEKALLILFLILLPVLNLTGVNLSRIRKRYAEFGVRKAFGATKRQLFAQVLNENLVMTLLGGALGLLLSFAFMEWSKSFLLTPDTMITWDMLISPAVFVAALGFCFLINLLSTLIPAWKISKEQITEALKE